jgi:4-diphosphocytidyl-2-C-methyl-D-erythritol kinase
MHVQRTAAGVVVETPAKLNLFLEVLRRRDDGFHDIETVITPIGLYDALHFIPNAAGDAAPIEFSWQRASESAVDDDWSIPANEQNLAVKAVELVRKRAGMTAGARLHLVKRIPPAAGLGGGSSDAAAALVAANLAWNVGYTLKRLAELAAELGSDVPFFLAGGPAVCRGRGERIERVPGGAKLHYVVVRPAVGLSTAEVYRNCQPAEAAGEPPRCASQMVAALQSGDPRSLAAGLHNRLEAAAARMSPQIDRLAKAFAELDLVGQQMSGSGSGYFGICRSARQARRAAAVLSSRGAGSVFAVTGL